MDVELDLFGFKRLQREIALTKKRVQAAVRQTVHFYAEAIEADARRNAPSDTGELAESFDIMKRGMMAAAFNMAEHAKPIEFGADPHEIGPADAPRLVFFWEREGRMFIGREGQSVDHPGNKAYNYFADAVDEQWPNLKRDVAKNVKRVLDA
jgi:hypothetical protein